jgi:hypothetical protein
MNYDLFTIHEKENNPISQSYRDENEIRFNKQCKHLFGLLMSGTEITRFSAMQEFKIMDLMRRKKDLVDKGVKLSCDKKHEGLMVVYMSESDKTHNKTLKIIF